MVVNPAPGALVRHPSTRQPISDGAEIDPLDPYWARLLADRDILPAEPAPKAADAQPSDKKASN